MGCRSARAAPTKHGNGASACVGCQPRIETGAHRPAVARRQLRPRRSPIPVSSVAAAGRFAVALALKSAFETRGARHLSDDPRPTVDVELQQHLADMSLDCRFGDAELMGDQFLGEAAQQQTQHLPLLKRERGDVARDGLARARILMKGGLGIASGRAGACDHADETHRGMEEIERAVVHCSSTLPSMTEPGVGCLGRVRSLTDGLGQPKCGDR